FGPNHFFARQQILWLETVPEGEPRLSGKLVLSEEYLDQLTTGKIRPPRYSSAFPAKQLATQLNRQELILAPSTAEKLLEIERWIKHGNWIKQKTQLGKRLKPGFRALFYGPPGTGKTLAASILGNEYQKTVYRIDLSQIISKYIGETEKNLSKLFDKAANKDWILFFDEADALFGKRVGVKEAKDKYANQETAYLLQRIEDYPGLVILASNLKDNIDKAFLRRFHSIIHFPFPTAKERLQLWQSTLPQVPPTLYLAPQLDLTALAQRYKLTGANINNIVQYCCYLAREQAQTQIDQDLLLKGIRREFEKEGKAQ
ncbi:MAG: ATP-binding protein, partial [Bacteroidota bacterium]